MTKFKTHYEWIFLNKIVTPIYTLKTNHNKISQTWNTVYYLLILYWKHSSLSSQHGQHDSEVETETHDEKTHYNLLFLGRNDRSIDRSKDVFEECHVCAFF